MKLTELVEQMRKETEHEAKVAAEHDSLGRHSWGFKRTAEALNRYRLLLEIALTEEKAKASCDCQSNPHHPQEILE